ncbi:hypothetical protein L873DRAFT_1829191 [Choiromyces venosus 120613-1]|uniref:HNH nuclease domain-containing protein n=1 Tax=Choiromyces venosus 120613-1 TaxID=1336337 RepID=A0A3N4JL01_9PEZI|nr:hypothetical protein L873DRAFT_1829191 [Choiromyces venosus 120613-1]
MAETIQKGDYSFQPGKYFIVTVGSLTINDETWLVHTISVSIRTSATMFCYAFIIMGESAADAKSGSWWCFEVAHIFQLAFEEHWNYDDYGHLITNGVLLQACVQILLDNYTVLDSYRIVSFRHNCKGIAGRHLDERLLEDLTRALNQFLPWHFREAVLTNMRGWWNQLLSAIFFPVRI